MLDFSKLDSLPPNLHLGIPSPEERKSSIFLVSHQISSLVQPAMPARVLRRAPYQPCRVMDECCGSLLFVMKVSSGNKGPFKKKLADASWGQ
jgi:hypothetical protein